MVHRGDDALTQRLWKTYVSVAAAAPRSQHLDSATAGVAAVSASSVTGVDGLDGSEASPLSLHVSTLTLQQRRRQVWASNGNQVEGKRVLTGQDAVLMLIQVRRIINM